jgi:hypothetical protein
MKEVAEDSSLRDLEKIGYVFIAATKEKIKCEFDIGNDLHVDIIEGFIEVNQDIKNERMFADGPNISIIKGYIKQEDKIECEFHDNRYALENIIKGFFNYILNIQQHKIQFELGDSQDFEILRRIWWIDWFQWIWWTEWSWWKWSISDSAEDD